MSEAVLVTPAYDAEMVTGVDAVTALVLTVNVALLAPADSHAGRDRCRGRAAAGEGDSRTASECWPAQRHRASGGLHAASHTRGIQRQRRESWRGLRQHGE